MGWSCSTMASNTLEKITQACIKQTGTQNYFVWNNSKYFIEWSRREHRDGAVTGTLFKIVGDLARKSGSVRIEGDGTISRGPKFIKDIEV